MKGGESGGGLIEGRECWGWWMLPCMRGEAGTSSVVVARRLLITCRLLFMCRLPVACCLLFACRFLFACRLPIVCRLACRLPIVCRLACRLSLRVVVVPRCQWVVVLGVCGFSWCRAPMAIHGWWCGHVVVSWSGGEASSSSSMGWPLTIPQRPCQRWARLLSDRHPGAANEVSEVGGDDDGVVTHIPQRPRHVRGMGAPLVHYRARTVVLGLQTRLVRWGVMTTGGRSPSPAPSHVRGMGALPVRCRACTCVCCIEGHADGGCR